MQNDSSKEKDCKEKDLEDKLSKMYKEMLIEVGEVVFKNLNKLVCTVGTDSPNAVLSICTETMIAITYSTTKAICHGFTVLPNLKEKTLDPDKVEDVINNTGSDDKHRIPSKVAHKVFETMIEKVIVGVAMRAMNDGVIVPHGGVSDGVSDGVSGADKMCNDCGACGEGKNGEDGGEEKSGGEGGERNGGAGHSGGSYSIH